MWPHFRTVPRSKIDVLKDDDKWKGQQSGNDLYSKILDRATCSLPARRASSNPHTRVLNMQDLGKVESQGSSSDGGESFTQGKNNFTQSEVVLPTKKIENLQPLGYYRPPLQENSPFSGNLPFKKYISDKEQCPTDSYHSPGIQIKRKHSPSSFSFTKNEPHSSRKKHAVAPDSQRTLLDSYDPFKLINFQPNSANELFSFFRESVTYPNSRESSEEHHTLGNFTTSSVQNYPSPDDILRNSKESLSSPFLSPESLVLPRETPSSPESVYEKMTFNKGRRDEDDDESVAPSQFSPTMDSVCEYMPKSRLNRNGRDYRTSVLQLQAVQTDPDEEYENLMSG